MNNPEWRSIVIGPKDTGYYVSSIGQVKNADGNLIQQYRIKKNDYPKVFLVINGITSCIYVHRLVAIYFIPDDENCDFVYHLNGKKYFNWVGNLAWMDSEKEWHSTIGKDQVISACELLKNPDISYKYIYKATGVPRHILYDIRKRRSYIKIAEPYFPFPEKHSRYFGYEKPSGMTPKITFEQAHEICRLLRDTTLSCPDIAKKLGVPLSIVSDISQGYSWVRISKDYGIPLKRKISVDRSHMRNEKTLKMIEWYHEGKPVEWILEHLQSEYGVPNKQRAWERWRYVKKKYINKMQL